MSSPDARLSAAERAALADLEAAAVAEDPQLAAKLKALPPVRHRDILAHLDLGRLGRAWSTVVAAGWAWAVPVTVAGLLMIVLGIGWGLPVSVAGAVVAAMGLRMLAEIAVRRRPARPSSG